MLQLVEVKKSYHKNKLPAVDGISFQVNAGEVVGFIGANGAGKSTTVSMIATLIKPDDGQIMFHGKDIVRHPEVIRKKLGYVPQDIALYETLSGEDNLSFWARAYRMRQTDYLKNYKKVCDIIGFTDDMLKKKVKEYSGGMKRRLNIGVALLHEPELVIMDEPTAGIDISSRNLILSSIGELSAGGTSIIYVGHYMEEVEKICNRICILDKGKCLLDATLDAALNQPGGRITLEQLYEKIIVTI